MAWSYSGNPGDSNLDEIRFWSQLTNEDDQRLTDEEILFLSSVEKTNKEGAAACCEVLATRYASEADIRAGADGELSIKMSQLSEQFARRAIALRSDASKRGIPWSAAISKERKAEQEENSDRTVPSFRRNQFESDDGVL